jgi:KDO2-lipid IV(A) lauroyltransferase
MFGLINILKSDRQANRLSINSTYMTTTEILKKHWYDFLAPRFWGMWLAFGLLRLLICLPYPLILKVGHGMGHLARILSKGRYKITATNLKLCFPELSEKEREVLLKKSFASLGLGILEAALAWWGSDKRLFNMLEVHGVEHLKAAQAKNQGVLLITAHFSTLELGARLLSYVVPTTILHRSQKNPLFEWVLQRARRRYIKKIILHNDIRSLLKTLKEDEVICYTPDQDKGPNSSIFAPFFGVQTATVKATSAILKHTKAAAVPLFYFRDEARQKYVGIMSPMLTDFPTGDDVKDAMILNKMFEDMIRQQPDQYMWQVQRFRTRPPGEPRIYD